MVYNNRIPATQTFLLTFGLMMITNEANELRIWNLVRTRNIVISTAYYVMQWELQVNNYKPEKDK